MSDFLVIFIAVILLFSVFRRYIAFALMGFVTKKLFEQAQRQQNRYAPPAESRPPGSVKVDTGSQRQGGGRDNGDYVEFEEIKD